MILAGVCFFALLALLVLWLVSEKTTKYREEIDKYKKDYIFSIFFSVAYFFLNLLGITERSADVPGGLFGNGKKKRIDLLKKLYGDIEYRLRYKMHWANIISSLYLTLIAVFFLTSIISYKEAEFAVPFSTELSRPAFNEDAKTYDMNATFKEGEEEVNQNIQVVVEGRTPTADEAKQAVKDTLKILGGLILNGNESFNKVTHNLAFISKCEETGVDLGWLVSDPKLINPRGELFNSDITGPINVDITVKLKVLDVYSEDSTFTITILPLAQDNTLKPSLSDRVGSYIDSINKSVNEDASSNTVVMPSNIPVDPGVQVEYASGKKSNVPLIILVCLLFGGVLVIYVNAKLKEQIETRAESIKMDFPEMLNKLILMITAGTTVQTAIDKVISDYRNTLSKGLPKRPLYEELHRANDDIRGDKKLHFSDAYENFAKRCMVQEAIRFSALIIQYMKDGSDQFVSMLRLFSTEAWAERKRIAERRGKAAENKLLVPILLIFAAILLIVMTPITQIMKI